MIDDAAWRELMNRIPGIEHMRVRIGVFSGAVHTGAGISLIELAAIHEFGAPAANIPERSFIRSTLREKQDMIRVNCAAAAKALLAGKTTPDKALGKIGLWLASEMQKKIVSGVGIAPPLKPSTIARKGSDRPLIDTGQLKNSITFQVVP